MMLNKKKAMALASLQTLDDVEYLDLSYLNTDAAIQRFKTNRKIDWSKNFTIKGTTCLLSNSHRAVIIGSYSSARSMNIEWNYQKLRMYLTPLPNSYVCDVSLSPTFPLNKPIQFEFSWDSTTGGYTFKGQTLDGATSDTKTGITPGEIRSGLSNNVFLIGTDYQRITSPSSAFDGTTRVYKLEYIEDGVLVNRWKPRVKNKVPVLYDEINNEYFTNEGPGYCESGRKIREVEYLNLEGQVRFNTLFKPNTLTTTYKTNITPKALGTFPFGVRRVANYNDSCATYIATSSASKPNGYLRLDWLTQASPVTNIDFQSGFDNSYEIEITGNYAKVNGVEYTSSTATSYDQPAPFYIGNCYTTSTGAFQSYYKGFIRYAQLLNTTTRELYRDYIPAIDENGVAFLFDKVSHTVFLPETGTITKYGRRIIPVEYLESTGTQYIDTLVNADSNLGIKSIQQLTETTTSKGYGACYDGSPTKRHHFWTSPTRYMSYYLSADSYNSFSSSIDKNKHTIEYNPQTGKYYYDGTEYAAATTNTFDCGLNYWLFGRNINNSTNYRLISMKSFAFEMKSSGNLVRDYIPAKDENAVGFMFDRVTHTIYDNAGTGKFKFGGLV